MKNNQPVTTVEYVLKDTDSIVSKTDLKGQITYVNEDFLRISGFSESELIGAPHNIVRHPDMPPEAFADFWASLKANRPWTGIVKNRCKNGDFYWVLANATPIYESGQCIGYLSVRSKPGQEQIRAAQSAYRMFREGHADGLRIKDGQVVKPSLLGNLNLLKNVSIKTRMVMVLAAMSLSLLSIGIIGLYGMSNSNEGLRRVYEDRTVPLQQLSEIRGLLLRNRLDLTSAALNPTAAEIEKDTVTVEKNIIVIGKTWDDYMATPLTPEEKTLAEKFAADRKVFVAQGLKPAIAMLRDGNSDAAKKHMIEVARQLYKPVHEDINALVDLQISVAKQEYGDAQAHFKTIRNQSVALILLGALMAIWALLTVFRGIISPIEKVVSLLQLVSQGKYNNQIDVQRQDEIGKLIESIKSMQIKLGFDVAEALRVANENLRIKIGLDNVSTSVMISDTERNIIYMNKAVHELMQTAESDLRKELPNFNAATLLGSSIDQFHKNPEHQKSMLASLSSTHRKQIEVGGRTFALAANPVINERGTRLGTALEWKDRTTEVAVEKEVAGIVEAAVNGDFTERIGLQGKEGFFKQLAEGINKLMETSDRGLQEVVRMLGSLARGDLTDHITNEYAGTFGQLKDDANATSAQLKEIIGQIKDATDTINTAAKEIAAGNNDLSQRTEEQASSLEETASSMEELTSTVKQNAENAKQANQLAIGASDIASKGGSVVGQVVTTMDSINESSRKIVDIISVIDGIAFQTNILALNAAVEAARAGEQGRGFAVVAGEVRNLAQRSAAAAKEIKTLIGDSVEKVEGGSKLVAQAGQTMEEIVTAIKRVTDIMSEITAASQEQSQGIEQVNTAITQMDEVTQQNAALVEEAAAAAESLEEQAQNLAVSVGTFKMDSHSSGTAVARRETAPAARAPARKGTAVAKAAPGKAAAVKPKAKPGGDDDGEWEEF
ncbi:MAG: methyl-accepting chemotaxis protein [Gallionella sp.]|nr:methyl-accepting chemotaxis protein [Gallionella sp.]